MTASHTAGPEIVFGSLLNLQGTGGSGSGGSNPEAGPSGTYMGDCVLDPRVTYQPGVTGVGKVFGFYDGPYVQLVNAIPSANGAAKVAAAQTATSGTALTLVSARAAGIQPNAPMIPAGSQYRASNVVLALALDYGFATCTTTSGSAVITSVSPLGALVPGSTVIVGAGASNTCIAATVLSISGSSVTLDTNMGASVTGAALALANSPGLNNAGTSATPPVAMWPWNAPGHMAVFDARSGLTRGLSVTSSSASDTGWSVAVTGYDLFGVPMHETIAVTANSVAYGNKTWKYITSVTPSKGGGGTSVGTFSIGTSDLFGFSLRCSQWEAANVFWNGTYLTTSTGFVVPDATSPATATTKDVRGAMQVSGVGPLGSGASSTQSNGSIQFVIYVTLQASDVFTSNPNNVIPLFGVTQF